MNASTIRSGIAAPAAIAPAAPAAFVPGGQPTPADREASPSAPAAHPFAEMLRQNRLGSSAAPAETPPPASESPDRHDADAAEATDTTPDAAPAKAPVAMKTKARVATAAPSPGDATEQLDKRSAKLDSDNPAADDAHDRHAAPGDAASVLAADALAARAVAASAARAGESTHDIALASERRAATGATASADAALATEQGTGNGADRRVGRDDPAAGARTALLDAGRDTMTAKLADATFAQALAESAITRDATPQHGGSDASAGSTVAMAALQGGSTTTGDAPRIAEAPTQLTLSTPIDAPDFAANFGVQVSLLTQGGVQHAELHLNPAEMGPVSIHIALEGSEARIDFGADLAATRHAIEAGLPELAGALRDAGFTLTGGGVSQHAGERGRSDDGAATRPSARVEGPGSPAQASELSRAVRRVSAGGVDLYA